MFNKHLALLQPEQERIQCYLGAACRTTPREAAKLWDQLRHRDMQKSQALSPGTGPGGTRVQLSPVCRPENFAAHRKRDFISNASEQHYSGGEGQAAPADKESLHCFTLN